MKTPVNIRKDMDQSIRVRAGWAFALGVGLAAVGLAMGPGQDLSKELRDKDPATRQGAVQKLADSGEAKAGEWLERALDDEDWGVVGAALGGLAQHEGSRGDSGILKEVAGICLESPILNLRKQAAKTLALLGGADGAKALEKKLSNKKLKARAMEGLAQLSRYGVVPEDLKGLEKILKHKKSVDLHPLAARAILACCPSEEKPERLKGFLDSERLLIRSQALEGLADSPDGVCVPTLIEALNQKGWNPVIRRRLVRALVACVGAIELEAGRTKAIEKTVADGLGNKLPGAWARARFVALCEPGGGATGHACSRHWNTSGIWPPHRKRGCGPKRTGLAGHLNR